MKQNFALDIFVRKWESKLCAVVKRNIIKNPDWYDVNKARISRMYYNMKKLLVK